MFRIVCTLAAAAVVGLAGFAAAQGAASTALAQAVAATTAAETEYAFDVQIETAKLNWQARFDPDATPRLRLVSPRRDELENSERRAFDRIAEDYEGVSWCANERLGRVTDVRLVREDETSAVYAFQPTPESIRGEQARPYAERLRGEMTIDKTAHDVTRVRLYTPEAFSPLPLVRVDRANIVVTCAAAPNGRRFASETVTEFRGSALGQAFDERSVQRQRNLSAS
jgi:hypothetical protein